jgi:hypothetical protein
MRVSVIPPERLVKFVFSREALLVFSGRERSELSRIV